MEDQNNLNYTPLNTEKALDKQIEPNAPKKHIGGFNTHPENINKTGRPKRKTITEVLYAKLSEKLKDKNGNLLDKDGFDAIVNLIIQLATEKKDREIIKEIWHYLDGMPKQKFEHEGEIGIRPIINKPLKNGS